MTVSGEAVSGKEAAALALHRFGFGPVGDQINDIAADPRGALQADLDRPAAGELKVDLPTSAEAARAVSDFQAERRAQQILAQRAQKEAEANAAPPCPMRSGAIRRCTSDKPKLRNWGLLLVLIVVLGNPDVSQSE